MSGDSASARIVSDDDAPTPDWDRRAVDVPGGHVMQSATWGEIRAAHGFEPHYLAFEDGRATLALLRRSAGLPGAEAIVRRGPAHAADAGPTWVARAVALAGWARDHGARTLTLDPELPADAGYAAAMDAAGFDAIDGPEPSIHVMRRSFAPGLDEEALLHSFSKSTRQRLRAAEAAGTSVRESSDEADMLAFAQLLHQRADVVGMRLQAGTAFIEAWRRLVGMGLARLLLARHAGELVGGLLLFCHGGIHATAYSADDADRRAELPGTMHLVRWTAIRDAHAEGRPHIDLGGVDLPGHRQPPAVGDPSRGLYEHKRGFGAEWVEQEPARRIVLRPGAERLARARRRAVDAVRGVGR